MCSDIKPKCFGMNAKGKSHSNDCTRTFFRFFSTLTNSEYFIMSGESNDKATKAATSMSPKKNERIINADWALIIVSSWIFYIIHEEASTPGPPGPVRCTMVK